MIFARMGSSRLPGKALRPIGDAPLLGWVLARARRVAATRAIVIATTRRADDDAIADFAAAHAAAVFRGAAEDVAGRALACAEHHGFDRFARVCGDSPFFDPEIVDRLIARHVAKGLDIATNVFPRTFPSGASVEVVATAALRRALAAMTDATEREHMTQYFYRHPEDFSISNLAATDERYADVALAVDTPDDLARSRWMVAQLGDRASTASLDDLAALAPAWTQVTARAAVSAR